MEELQGSVKEIKTMQWAGCNGCAAECLKNGGTTITAWLVRLPTVCFVGSMLPVDFASA